MFQVVGYGLQSVKPTLSQLRIRLKAWVQLVNLGSALTDGFNIQTTNAAWQGPRIGRHVLRRFWRRDLQRSRRDRGGEFVRAERELRRIVVSATASTTRTVQEWILSFLE